MEKTVKVVMMRKVSSVQEWIEKAATDRWGVTVDAVVEKTVTLTKEKFQKFENDLLEDRDFIIENNELMMADENQVWHVIKVQCTELPYELYINSEGYNYARYTGVRVKEVNE